MNELQQVLNDIKQDKNTNLLPGNLRDNVTCLGVEGTAKVPTPIYATTDYYTLRTDVTRDVLTMFIDKWVLVYGGSSIEAYYNGNAIGNATKSYSGNFSFVCTITDDYFIIAFSKADGYQKEYETFKITKTSVERIGDLQTPKAETNLSYLDGLIYSYGSNALYKYDETTNTLDLLLSMTGYAVSDGGCSVPNILSDYTTNTSGYERSIFKIQYDNVTDSYSYINKNILRTNGVNYYGNKIFIDGNVYELYDDLTVGDLLKENVYNVTTANMRCINDKYYLYNSELYIFDEENNTFEQQPSLTRGNYVYTISGRTLGINYSSTYYDTIIFNIDNRIVGYKIDNNTILSSNKIYNSNNILSGKVFYDNFLNNIIGTMPNNGELNITPTTENQNIPEGYTSGGTVLGDENLKSENIKKDVSIFGVTGSLESSSGQIKLFETVEEMQADSTAKEGDLAVVYREEIQNMTATSNSQYITFPETVKLPSQLTSSYYGMIRAVDPSTNYFDGMVQLNSSSFRFDGYGDIGSIIVEYESSDGTNYTRTTFTLNSEILTNPVDMSTPIGPYYEEDWNDLFGYFMQVNGKYFDGLYEYGTYIDYFKVYMYRNLTVSDENVTYDSKVPFDFNTIENVLHTFMEDNGRTVDTHFLITLKNDIVKLYYDYVTTSYPDTTYYYLDGNNWYASYEDGSSFTKCTKHIEINLSDLSIQFVEDDGQLDMTSDSVCVLYYYQTRKLQDTLQMIFYVNSHNIYFDVEFAPTSEYIIADNQYTLASSNQLLPGISGYGKNGTVVGDDSLYSNLEWSEDVLSNCPTDVYLSYINKPYNSQNLSIIYNTKQKANVEHGISFNGSNLYILSFEINIDKIKSIVGEDEMQYQSFNINRIYALGNKLYIVCVDYNPSNDDSAYNIFIVMYDTHSSLYTVSKFNSVDNDVSVGQWLSGRPVVQLTEDKSHLIIFMNILENTYNKIDEATDCYMQVIDYNIIEDTFNLILNCKLNDMIFDSIENASAYAQSAWKYNNTVYFSHSEMRSTPSLCTYNRLDAIDINTQKVTNVYTQSVDSIWSLPRFNSWMNGYRILLDNNMCYFLKYSSDRKVTLSKLNMDDNTISDLKQLPITLKSNHVSHETYDMRKEGNIIYLYTDFATDGASSSDFYRVCVYMYNIEDSTLTTIYEADVDEHDGDSGSHGHFVISNNHLYLMTESLHLEIKGNQVTPIEVPYGQDFGNGQHYDVNGITYSTGINEGLQVVLADSKITNDLSSRFTLMVTSYPQEQYSGRTGILYKISDTDNSTPISQDEYNEAVDITKQILGIE